MNLGRTAAGIVLAVMTTAIALVGAEAALRRIDGYPLRTLQLQHAPQVVATDLDRAMAHVRTLDVAPGVDRIWFTINPDRPASPPPDPVLKPRLPGYWTVGLPSLYEWNREYLEGFACRDQKAFTQAFGPYKDVFVFDALNGVEFPRFRFLRQAAYPSGLVTNEFGWRGPDVALDKPARTIRIAFIGSSTTVGAHSAPFSYPEVLGGWLNLWARARGLDVRFETLNAAREGIDSSSIAEVVRQEVLPLEPDLVVYYEGSNQFWPAAYIEWKDGKQPERPRRDPRTPWKVERFSVLALRARSLYDALRGTGLERAKPPLPVRWPAELNEFDPPLASPLMPVNLGVILPDIETMRTALAESGGELVVSSFFWFVWDGMRLDPIRHAGIWSYLNETFWPFSYAHMRRMADFQNRVFTKYARVKGIDLLDFASAFPRDPGLFVDAIHFSPDGMRLQGWVVLQKLIPLIERRVAGGQRPRADRTPLAEHPAFAQNPRRLEPVSSFGTHCAK